MAKKQIKNEIILVDENDKKIGAGEKLQVHREGKLHRAFSVFIFNKKGELLLQKRVKSKYHSPGLWSNTCCSHPRPGKNIRKEAEKRLQEEMGFICPLKEVFVFHYKAELKTPHTRAKTKLIENEIDHVFIGKFNGAPKSNPKEAEGWRWLAPGQLKKDIKQNPQNYTPWLKKILNRPDF